MAKSTKQKKLGLISRWLNSPKAYKTRKAKRWGNATLPDGSSGKRGRTYKKGSRNYRII
jgi:hypothetical protein